MIRYDGTHQFLSKVLVKTLQLALPPPLSIFHFILCIKLCSLFPMANRWGNFTSLVTFQWNIYVDNIYFGISDCHFSHPLGHIYVDYGLEHMAWGLLVLVGQEQHPLITCCSRGYKEWSVISVGNPLKRQRYIHCLFQDKGTSWNPDVIARICFWQVVSSNVQNCVLIRLIHSCQYG